MFASRYGWQYTQCESSYYFVCETRDHIPEFIQSGPFLLSRRKLKFDDARSLCRAQYYDLATIYEEEEYKTAQSLCSNYTINDTNCWIGYEKGIINENEWEWIQDIPTSVIPINELINTDLWSIMPWQISKARIYCQAAKYLTILFASDGQNFNSNITGEYSLGEATFYEAVNVLYESLIQFEVSTNAEILPGLKCSVYFEDDIYNTYLQKTLCLFHMKYTHEESKTTDNRIGFIILYTLL